MTIKSIAATATFWSGIDVIVRFGLKFGISIVLARLLAPEEFGTIALLALFTGLATVFVDGGLSAAIIQRGDITHIDESSVFWFNIVVSAVVGGVMVLLSPLVANFFNAPILVPLLGLMAINLVIASIGSIHTTLLTKQLDFKSQAKIGAVSTVISGMVAIYSAWKGYEVWALAWQILISSAVTTALLWLFSEWRPLLKVSFQSLRNLFRYGGFLLLAGVLDTVYSRLHTLLIGKLYSFRELGIFHRADNTQQVAVGALTTVFSRTMFPVFSSVAHDKKLLRKGVAQSVRYMMLINVPIMLGIFSTADAFILTVFGEKWAPSIHILQILSMAGLLWPLHVINLNLLKALGYSKLFFRLELIKKCVGIILVLVGSVWGIHGIAWSQVVLGLIAFFVNSYYSRAFISYGVTDQFREFFSILVVGVAMMMAVICSKSLFSVSPAQNLLIQATVGVIVYIVLCEIFALKAYREVKSLSVVFRKKGGR